MTSASDDTRLVSSLRTGTKVCLIIALLLLAAAAYFYFVPVVTKTSQGGVFACGSAASPPTETFPKNVCSKLPDVFAYRAYACLAAAILTALGGFLLFGVDKHEQVRREARDGGSRDDSRDEQGRASDKRGLFEDDEDGRSSDQRADVARDEHVRSEQTRAASPDDGRESVGERRARRRRWEDDGEDASADSERVQSEELATGKASRHGSSAVSSARRSDDDLPRRSERRRRRWEDDDEDDIHL